MVTKIKSIKYPFIEYTRDLIKWNESYVDPGQNDVVVKRIRKAFRN